MGLYMEGKVGELNTYVCLQLRTQHGGSPYIAFTSCVLKNPSPQWHEVFRFDTESVDPSACLVAWVIAAPGDEANDVIMGTELGLSEDQLHKVKAAQMRTGIRLTRGQPEFSTAMQSAFDRLTKRADRNEYKEVARLRKLAMAQARGCEPTMDLVLPKSKASSPLEERRWDEVSNLRALLERSGCDIQDPLVPRTHLPLGCVVLRFRQLREAVWGTEPVEISRTLRLNCRGNLRIELDFRPRFFQVAANPRLQQLTPQEEEDIYSVKPLDPKDDSFDMLSPYKPLGELPDPLQKQLQDHKRAEQGRGDPQKLFKRFNQVLAWSQATLETAEEERLLRRQQKQKAKSREPKREEATAQSRIKDLAEMGRAGVVDAAATYQDWKQQKKARREKMDRPWVRRGGPGAC